MLEQSDISKSHTPTKSNPIRLRTQKLSLGYGETCLVDDLTLDIPQGQFTALIGPNGSGKSTILRGLSGLLAPQKGAVHLDDRPITSLAPKMLARQIGLLSQESHAPEGMTVWELVRQGRYPHRTMFDRWGPKDEKACSQAIELTGMQAFRDRPLQTLSGGQRQRAWISLSLAQQTDILLLDEPTTFLDLAHQIEILDLVASLVQEQSKTVVAILHDLNLTARYADHIILLKDGKVLASGNAGQVIHSDIVEQAFGIACDISQDPVSGDRVCMPRSKRRRQTV